MMSSSLGNSEWRGYELNLNSDDIEDCSPGCRNCYYKCRDVSIVCKVVIVTSIIIFTVLLTSLIIRFAMFGPRIYQVGDGDQRPLGHNEDNGFSRLFCSEYTLTSMSTPPHNFSSFLYMNKPKMSTDRLRYELSVTSLLQHGEYSYWVNYFQSTTSVTVSGCTHTMDNTDALQYTIRGEDNYKKEKSTDSACKSCYYHEDILKPCSESESKFNIVVNKADIYYFVYTLDYGLSEVANVSLRFFYDRPRYDTDDAFASCEDVTSCKLTIPQHASGLIIEEDVGMNEHPNTIRAICTPRLSMYMAFFVGLPTGLILVFASIGLILKRCQDDLIRDLDRADRIREYQRAQASCGRPTRGTIDSTDRNNQVRFSSSSRTTARTLPVSPTAALVEHEQLVGSLPPNYNSLVTNGNAQVPTSTHEPSPPTYQNYIAALPPSITDQETQPPSYASVQHNSSTVASA